MINTCFKIPRRPFLPLACLLLAVGCGTPATRPARPNAPEAQALADLQAQQYAAAAAEFQRLAEVNTDRPARALMYRLRAVAAWLQGGSVDTATSLLNQLTVPAGDAAADYYRRVLQARIALHNGQPAAAAGLLPTAPPAAAPPFVQRDRLQVLAAIREAQEDYIAAARARMQLAQYLEGGDAVQDNRGRIWKDLNAADTASLQAVAAGSGSTLAGWIELALINKTLLFQPEQLRQAVAQWRGLYPQHPANPRIVTQMLDQAASLNKRPANIALLLPFDGPYKQASEAIREGFLAAWYAAAGNYQPVIRIYNAATLNILDTYRQAVADGADFVVGPLEKNAIRTLVQAGAIKVDTLALNRLEKEGSGEFGAGSGGGPRLYQFALAPEDEVHQVAARARTKGYRRALVITPDNDWGARLSSTFAGDWREDGGSVLDAITFKPDSQDFITPVKRLLNIDSSDARISRLRHVLSRNIIGSRRRRQDADFIYMAAAPLNGRQIVPQFRYFRVKDLPIYSTSQVYTGHPEPQLDADMDGVEFTDIPWVLRPPDQRPPIQISLENDWQSQDSPYRRLYAFGVDAFRLITRLGHMSVQPDYSYAGQTGALTAGADGRIHRQLRWARFVDGRPELLPTGDSAGGGG